MGELTDFGYEEALDAFTRATELDPEWATAWNRRGQTLDQLGRSEEAVAALTRGTELDSEDSWGWSYLADALSSVGAKHPRKAPTREASSLSVQGGWRLPLRILWVFVVLLSAGFVTGGLIW